MRALPRPMAKLYCRTSWLSIVCRTHFSNSLKTAPPPLSGGVRREYARVMKTNQPAWMALLLAAGLILAAPAAKADRLNCSLSDYHALPGLAAAVAGEILTV